MTATSPAALATEDPIGILLAEHRTILQVLSEADRERARLEHTGILRTGLWHDVLRFLREFDLGVHHQKEDNLLFRALEGCGLSPNNGPTTVLRDEHRRMEHWQGRLEHAIHHRDAPRIAAAAANYCDLARTHILKENQIVFPLSRRLLAPQQLAMLHAEFVPLAAELRIDRWLPSLAQSYDV
jgi:hemerythrin-like domain-containing protein